jgi:uncharacterized RDD family membrane protein YckC
MQVRCTRCGISGNIDDSKIAAAGLTARCPRCGERLAAALGQPQGPGAAAAEAPELNSISGFWRRLFAFIIDVLLLGLCGLTLGFFCFDFLAGLGALGRLLGFGIALIYFGILNSSIGGGQTIGKRFAKIKVTDTDGRAISLPRSSWRYVILAVPFFLNNAPIPAGLLTMPVTLAVTLIVFGGGGAIVYLFVFNRRTRQSLHDLMAGTYVVRSSIALPVGLPRMWRGHVAVVGALLLAVVLATTLWVPSLGQRKFFKELSFVQERIQQSGMVQYAQVSAGKSWGTHGTARYFKVNVVTKKRPENFDEVTAAVASIVLNEYPPIMDQDVMVVVVTYGYDIGIASAWQNFTARHSPQEWRRILRQMGKGGGAIRL